MPTVGTAPDLGHDSDVPVSREKRDQARGLYYKPKFHQLDDGRWRATARTESRAWDGSRIQSTSTATAATPVAAWSLLKQRLDHKEFVPSNWLGRKH